MKTVNELSQVTEEDLVNEIRVDITACHEAKRSLELGKALFPKSPLEVLLIPVRNRRGPKNLGWHIYLTDSAKRIAGAPRYGDGIPENDDLFYAGLCAPIGRFVFPKTALALLEEYLTIKTQRLEMCRSMATKKASGKRR